jgi:hypothetical protein
MGTLLRQHKFPADKITHLTRSALSCVESGTHALHTDPDGDDCNRPAHIGTVGVERSRPHMAALDETAVLCRVLHIHAD